MTNPYAKTRTFETTLIRSEVLSPAEFLALRSKSPSDIKKSRPVGPTLGNKGFGGIEVTYVTAKYRTA